MLFIGTVKPHAAARFTPGRPLSPFKLNRPADGYLTLHINCTFSPVQAGYHDLLVAMFLRWPEIQAQLAQTEIKPSEDGSETDLTSFNWRDWVESVD
jgi:hypothetical protein